MSAADLAAYAAAVFVLFITPGPGMLALIGRTADDGAAHGAAFGAGIFTGDIVILAIVVSGLAAAAQAVSDAGPWIWGVKAVAAGYLAFLGVRAARAAWRGGGPGTGRAVTDGRRSMALAADFGAGFSIPFGNPKPLMFYGVFVPTFFDVSAIGPPEFAAMVAVMAGLAVVTIGLYTWAAVTARGFLASAGFSRVMQTLVALVFFAMAALLLTR